MTLVIDENTTINLQFSPALRCCRRRFKVVAVAVAVAVVCWFRAFYYYYQLLLGFQVRTEQ